MTYGRFGRSAIKCELHIEQKRRNLPGEDSYDKSFSWEISGQTTNILISSTDPLNRLTRYGYDKRDKLVTVVVFKPDNERRI